jgi:hypothetical protein
MDNLYKIMKNGPHVVLLGAGASYACILNGDKNGQKISCMNDFFENTGIDIGYQGSYKNLEDIYQNIDSPTKEILERKIRTYFNKFILPDDPTIYDVLIISLCKKDLIASFNWDPLLIQACQRCRKFTYDLPDIVFLHGNVWEWYSIDTNGIMTRVFAQSECPPGAYIKTTSGQRCYPTPLLLPEKNKEYGKNDYIKNAWDIFQNKLRKSFMFTIIGYSGPKSDEEVLTLLESGFLVKDKNGDIHDGNNYKQLSFIDINENVKDSFTQLFNIPQVPFTESLIDYVETLTDFWDEKNWFLAWPRLTTEGYTLTRYEQKFPPEKLLTLTKNNLTWDTIELIVKNQIKVE